MMNFASMKLFLSGLTLAAALSACSDDDSTTSSKKDDIPAFTENIRAEGYYKGDYHNEGTGNYWINFTVENKNDPEGYYHLCLDFNGSLAANPDFPQLSEGNYPMNTGAGYPTGTLNGDGDTYMARPSGEDDFIYSEAQNGSAKIEMIDGFYKVTCSLLLENDEVCDFEYYGPLVFYNRTLNGNMSNLTGDIALTLTQGMAIYYGNLYEMGSDAWNVVLAETNYNLDINYGQGDAVQLAFNVTSGAGDYIPNGTYTLLDANTAEEFPAGTMIAGIFDTTYGGYWGCWFYSVRRQLEARLDSGTVDVSREGDIYTLKIKLKDGAGHNIASTYTGKLIRYSAE